MQLKGLNIKKINKFRRSFNRKIDYRKENV